MSGRTNRRRYLTWEGMDEPGGELAEVSDKAFRLYDRLLDVCNRYRRTDGVAKITLIMRRDK